MEKNKHISPPSLRVTPSYFKRGKELATPQKIQDFLDKMPFNFEEEGETYMSPKRALRENKMHCFEGALFACSCLQKLGIKNYLLDLKVKDLKKDSDHTLCIFKINGFWGAISKTNHSVLRWRDPIYKTCRELAVTYFHEYFLDSGPPATPRKLRLAWRAGEKTLKSYSAPFDVWKKFGESWLTEEADLDEIATALDKSRHFDFVPKANQKFLRLAGQTEVKGAAVTEWPK